MSFFIYQHKGTGDPEYASAASSEEEAARCMTLADVRKNIDKYHRGVCAHATAEAFRKSLERSHFLLQEGENLTQRGFVYCVKTPEGSVMEGTCARDIRAAIILALGTTRCDAFWPAWEKKKAEGYRAVKVTLNKVIRVSTELLDV